MFARDLTFQHIDIEKEYFKIYLFNASLSLTSTAFSNSSSIISSSNGFDITKDNYNQILVFDQIKKCQNSLLHKSKRG